MERRNHNSGGGYHGNHGNGGNHGSYNNSKFQRYNRGDHRYNGGGPDRSDNRGDRGHYSSSQRHFERPYERQVGQKRFHHQFNGGSGGSDPNHHDRDHGQKGGNGSGYQKSGYQGNGNGYQRQRQEGGDRRAFGGRPSQSLVSMSQNAKEASSQTVCVATNQFRMRIGKNAPQMFQYPLRIRDDKDDPNSEYKCTQFEMDKIVDREKKRIEMLVGKYIHSGFNLWTEQQLNESLLLDTKLLGRKIILVIDHQGEFIVNTADIDNPNRAQCQAMSQILNIIVKQAMSETGMIQLGRHPRFFNHQNPIEVKDLHMQIWNGFKSSAYKYQSGCALILDNCCRFMSTQTVLSRIDEIYDQYREYGKHNYKQLFQEACRAEFIGQSIIANYGNKRTYIVNDINFEDGPGTKKFELKSGEKMTVAQYFYNTYKLKVCDDAQPMIVINQQGKSINIPSEFCLRDGTPDAIKNCGKSMRVLLNSVKQTPQQKMQSITQMINKLFKMSKWKEWDIQVEEKPETIESRRLAIPELVHHEGDDQRLFVNERLLKQLPVYNNDALKKTEMLILYDKNSISPENVKNVQRNLMNCQRQIGMQSREIQSHPVPGIRDLHLFRDKVTEIVEDMREDKRKGSSKENIVEIFIVMIVNREQDYQDVKRVFTDLNVMSQCIRRQTAQKFNMSVASNIMKQINSKLGGESLRIKLPKFMESSNVMVIGIDVCHASKSSSVVGVVASTNKHCTSFSSDIICQAKGQEIVKKDLDRVFNNALNDFQRNVGQYPDRLIIYRDGVSTEMRQQVIDAEISQFQAVLKDRFNSNRPKITLVVVNKRINQRMFIQENHQVQNPQPGTVLDFGLVENADGNECYDFFLVSQLTTQGCVTPTHFFVPLNESHEDVSKQEIEDLTFCMSFMYSNWSGSIKVPSLCQYAHKAAEYHHGFDKAGALKKHRNVDIKTLAYNSSFLQYPYYL